MSTETEIPRVSIDSLAQWREIRQNMMKAALQRLDERIRAGGLEAEREPMEAYIRKSVNEAMEIAQLNTRVNGTNWEDLKHTEADDDMEPFDESLDDAERALGTHRLDKERTIVDSRLYRPPQTLSQVQAALQQALEAEDELARKEEEELALEVSRQGDGMDAEEEVVDVESRMRPAYALARELEQSLPIQLERAKNFEAVKKEVMGLKR
ncbi:hypothetical protein BDV98DRAFT_593458 [Pterulicium gracile]|uniref:Kinetochore protein mis14 n=1 Tax=Pterulicium gracile TaxID=1884261 RepID=A0A5C3QKP9_9AGAR|nr:hypothetical protein BDV98DRAFT_593458 [Pterula gracilis]